MITIIIIIIITMGKFTDVLLSQSSIIWYWSRGGHTVWLDIIGLASYWPCITGLSGLSPYRFTA